MSMITLQKPSQSEVTLLSNIFIDDYMPEANGEFVKVYIYLLRALSTTPVSFTLEQMADHLLCTERDILRALKYWSRQELLALDFAADKSLRGIALLLPKAKASAEDETAAAALKQAVPAKAAPLTPDRVKELKQNEDIIQLLYIAEQYLGKTLSPTEIQKILFFYDGLGFSADLIEYLIEYCVSRSHKSIRYMETVALAWAQEGISTVAEAKKSNARYSKDYYSILKALGITNRSPVETEITLMDTWLKTYGFSIAIIQEACTRTVLQTGQASFQYTDSILTEWNRAGVRTMRDVEEVTRMRKEEARRARESGQSASPQAGARGAAASARQTGTSGSRRQGARKSSNRFHNLEEHGYDYDEMIWNMINTGASDSPGEPQSVRQEARGGENPGASRGFPDK